MGTKHFPYSGDNPGADSAEYVLFDSTATPTLQKGNLATLGLSYYSLVLINNAPGTAVLYFSPDDGVTWYQHRAVYMGAAATSTGSQLSFQIGMFRDIKVVWVNGGAAQITWAVAQALTDVPPASNAHYFGAVIDVTTAAETTTEESPVLDLFHNSGLCAQVYHEDDATGTLEILGSNDNTNFEPISEVTFAPIIEGESGELVDLSNIRERFVKFEYTHASGAGVFQVILHAKGGNS